MGNGLSFILWKITEWLLGLNLPEITVKFSSAYSGLPLLLELAGTDVPFGLIVSVSLIMAGAIGNILDSAFYGMIFSDSYGQVATLFPPDGGYSTFLHGRVVDMLYFPILEGHYPMWFPFWSGQEFIFFRPVFNLADSSITIGIFLILLFYRRFFDRQVTETSSITQTENID